MKKLIILAAMCVPTALLAMQSEQDRYTVSVAVDGTPTHVLLGYMIGQQPHTDTAAVRNGAFVFDGTAAERPALDARMEELMGQMRSMAKQYVAAHPDSWFALQNLFPNTFDEQNAEQVQASLNTFSERLRGSALGRERQKMIDEWRATQVNAAAPDFTQSDVDGNPVKLSSLRGKWVLVDFWASWCAPCRAENPNVVAVYHEFKERGFTVLGVSLDSKREPWLKAIADDKLEWTQLSDLAGWKNEAAALYSVKSIPANFLINPDGVIVARNLRGTALREELMKHLE